MVVVMVTMFKVGHFMFQLVHFSFEVVDFAFFASPDSRLGACRVGGG
jgi:hypothetical protein